MAPPLAPDVRDAVDETVEHFNANHADTVLLLARYAAGAAEASDAEAIAVDTLGVDFEVRVGAGVRAPRSVVRARFPAPAVTLEEIQAAVFTLIAEARHGAGSGDADDQPGARGRRAAARCPRSSRRCSPWPTSRRTCVRSSSAGPSSAASRRSVVTSSSTCWSPAPATSRSRTATRWPTGWRPTAASRPYGAYYTVRRWDPERAEITLWAVVHGHAEGVGGWFAHCAPGDRLAIWGPRHGFWSDGVYAAATTGGRHHLFVTDESGFAAVAALLDRAARRRHRHGARRDDRPRPRDHVPGSADQRALVVPGHARCRASARRCSTWSADTPATTARALATAFGAGESRQITEIRRYLRHEVGLPATAVSMTGYWRRD